MGQIANQQDHPPIDQNQVREIVAKGTKYIHSPERRGAIIDILGKTRPEEGIAQAAMLVMNLVDKEGRDAGVDFGDAERIIGGIQLVDQLVELGEMAKVFKPFTDAQRQLAFSLTVQHYLSNEIASGRIDPKKLQDDTEQAISSMPPDQRTKISDQVQGINKTAMGDTQAQGQPAAQQEVQ